MTEEIKKIIYAIFQKHGIEAEINEEDDLTTVGFNSRCYVEMIVALEELYDITISESDLENKNNKTITDIRNMLSQYVK